MPDGYGASCAQHVSGPALEPEANAPKSLPAACSNRLPVIVGVCLALMLVLVFVQNYQPRGGLERVMVSGTASYCGEPIVVGQIRFTLIPPSQGPLTVAQIRDGEFDTEMSRGLPVGNHRVEIKMYRPEEYATMGRSPGSPGPEQLLPEKYNRSSELTLNVASGSDPIIQNFTLTD